MFHATVFDRVNDAPRQAEESLARLGTLGVVAAGLMSLLLFIM